MGWEASISVVGYLASAVRRSSGIETVRSGAVARMYLSTDPWNDFTRRTRASDPGEHLNNFSDSAAGRARRLNNSVQDESLPDSCITFTFLRGNATNLFPCFLTNTIDEIKHRQATQLYSLLHFRICHRLLYFQKSWSWAAK